MTMKREDCDAAAGDVFVHDGVRMVFLDWPTGGPLFKTHFGLRVQLSPDEAEEVFDE